jgi:hypothetical protein
MCHDGKDRNMEIATEGVQSAVPGGNGEQGGLHLELKVQDPMVVKYLTGFEEASREQQALEALRVGVIAIRSATPTLDTRIVEEKFRQLEGAINVCITDFQNTTKGELDGYFKADSGSVPRSLETFLGERGTFTRLLGDYFSLDGGKVLRLIQEQVGPTSRFAQCLDPQNREGVIVRIEGVVRTQLQEKVDAMLKEFSLDQDGSAMSRLNGIIAEKLGEVRSANQKFFGELREALGIKAGQEIEAERGTEKGREFEVDLYNSVAAIGRALADETENVRALAGKDGRSKKGDFVLTLGQTSGAPGKRVVIEVKKERNYRLRDAIDELKEAKENREADVGIFVFAKGYEPAEVGDFLRHGQDFYVTVDEEALAKEQLLLFLEAAYKVVRALLVTSARKEDAKEVDVERVRREIESVVESAKRLSDLATKARTITSSSKYIEETVMELRTEMESQLAGILVSLG